MTTRRFLSSTLLTLTALLWFASAAEAKLEPRYYPPGSTTIAAYYDDHLNITLAVDMSLGFSLFNSAWGLDYQHAVNAIYILNHPNRGNSYLGLSNWRLPTASKEDQSCIGPLQELSPGSPNHSGMGRYCGTGDLRADYSEMGHIWYTEGNGQKGVFPTNWPFTGSRGGMFWGITEGMDLHPPSGPHELEPGTRLSFDLGSGVQRSFWEWEGGWIWPVHDGDPLGGPNLKLSAPDLDFGFQEPYTTSSPQSITLRNNGNGDGTKPLVISSISNSDSRDFPEQSGSCPPPPITLAKGAHCTISYNFAQSHCNDCLQ